MNSNPRLFIVDFNPQPLVTPQMLSNCLGVRDPFLSKDIGRWGHSRDFVSATHNRLYFNARLETESEPITEVWSAEFQFGDSIDKFSVNPESFRREIGSGAYAAGGSIVTLESGREILFFSEDTRKGISAISRENNSHPWESKSLIISTESAGAHRIGIPFVAKTDGFTMLFEGISGGRFDIYRSDSLDLRSWSPPERLAVGSGGESWQSGGVANPSFYFWGPQNQLIPLLFFNGHRMNAKSKWNLGYGFSSNFLPDSRWSFNAIELTPALRDLFSEDSRIEGARVLRWVSRDELDLAFFATPGSDSYLGSSIYLARVKGNFF